MGTLLLAGGTIGSQLDELFFGLDYSVFSFFGNIQNDMLTLLAKIFTAMGSTIYIVMFAVLGLVLCFFKRSRRVGFAIIFAVIIGTLITNIVVKPMVLRIRPYNTLQGIPEYWNWYIGAGMFSESDYSFPSGHTTGAMEVAMALCLCHATSKKKGARAFAWLFPVVALLVAASRVYLMVHYFTDVLAGLIVGIIAGVAGFFLSKLVCLPMKKAPKPVTRKVQVFAVLGIIIAWLVMFSFSFLNIVTADNENMMRCQYNGDYDCQNEAQQSSKYPPIDGKYYCKIHWHELSGE